MLGLRLIASAQAATAGAPIPLARAGDDRRDVGSGRAVRRPTNSRAIQTRIGPAARFAQA